jgi:hypothetical protein
MCTHDNRTYVRDDMELVVVGDPGTSSGLSELRNKVHDGHLVVGIAVTCSSRLAGRSMPWQCALSRRCIIALPRGCSAVLGRDAWSSDARLALQNGRA